MADLKISQLTAISVLTPATDVLPVVDSGGVTKKILVNQILASNGVASLASATITGDLTVDTSTLKVDSTNNRVGIGTASPAAPLDIQGTTNRLQVQSSSNGAYATWRFIGKTSAGAAVSFEHGVNIAADNAFELYDTQNSQLVSRYVNTGTHSWFLSGTTAMTLNSTGLGVGVTPAGTGGCLQLKSGITFPATQVASSDVNTLDDYEEGTWSPTITAGSGTPTTTTVNAAKYTKIGRLVTLEVDISITAIGTASGVLNFTVPTGFNQSTDGNVGALREVGATAYMGQIFYTAATTVGMTIYNNATVWVNGYRLRGTYTYTV